MPGSSRFRCPTDGSLSAAAVTVEPEAGSAQPTSPIVWWGAEEVLNPSALRVGPVGARGGRALVCSCWPARAGTRTPRPRTSRASAPTTPVARDRAHLATRRRRPAADRDRTPARARRCRRSARRRGGPAGDPARAEQCTLERRRRRRASSRAGVPVRLGPFTLVADGPPGRAVLTVFGPPPGRQASRVSTPHEPSLVFVGPLSPPERRGTVRVLGIDGIEVEAAEAGSVVVPMGGTRTRLRVLRLPGAGGEESELEIFFRDATNGRGTYPAGRFVALDPGRRRALPARLQSRAQSVLRLQLGLSLPGAMAGQHHRGAGARPASGMRAAAGPASAATRCRRAAVMARGLGLRWRCVLLARAVAAGPVARRARPRRAARCRSPSRSRATAAGWTGRLCNGRSCQPFSACGPRATAWCSRWRTTPPRSPPGSQGDSLRRQLPQRRQPRAAGDSRSAPRAGGGRRRPRRPRSWAGGTRPSSPISARARACSSSGTGPPGSKAR